MRAAKALTRLHGCAGSSEPSLFADALSNRISCANPYNYFLKLLGSGPRSTIGCKTNCRSSIPAQSHIFYSHSPPAESKMVCVGYKQKYSQEVMVNHLVNLSLPRKKCGEFN